MEIPDVKQQSAAVISGEIGPHVEAFKTIGHLASWAGVSSPGSNESAGKKKVHSLPKGKNI